MSQERVLKTLENYGLTKNDSKVYLFLLSKNLQRGRDLANGLRIPKQQLYRSLKSLQSRGIVNITFEKPARYSAVPLEKVLDSFVKAKFEETQRLQQEKTEILSEWHYAEISNENEMPPKFNVIEGRASIYPRIQQMIEGTENRISAIASVSGLIQANEFGLFDVAQNRKFVSRTQFRFLTDVSQQNEKAAKTLLSKLMNTKINFDGRTPEEGLTWLPRMVVKDEDEIIFFITPRTNNSMVEQRDVCLWTNCKPLIQAFLGVFEELWKRAANIESKITQTKKQ